LIILIDFPKADIKADIYVTVEADGRMWRLMPQTKRGEERIGVRIRGALRLTALESESICTEAINAGLVVRGDPTASATPQ
jgi:hypothetical protein